MLFPYHVMYTPNMTEVTRSIYKTFLCKYNLVCAHFTLHDINFVSCILQEMVNTIRP